MNPEKTVDNPHEGDIAAAVDAGREALAIDSKVTTIGETDVPIGISGGVIKVLDTAMEHDARRLPAPRRRRGTATLTELGSFVAHVNRAKNTNSVVFANDGKLTAVYNYYPGNDVEHAPGPPQAAWADHRAIYTCPKSLQWKAWLGRHESSFSQDSFAEFIDAHNDDIIDGPDGYAKRIEMLSLTRDLQIFTKGTFQRSTDRTTGAFSLICKQEHADNSTPIPRAFVLALPVFVGGKSYQVEARLRLKMQDGSPLFSYALQRPTEIADEAFAEVRETVGEKTALPVFAGSPE